MKKIRVILTIFTAILFAAYTGSNQNENGGENTDVPSVVADNITVYVMAKKMAFLKSRQMVPKPVTIQ